MRSRKTVGLTMAALAAFLVGTLSIPGCGDTSTEIQEDRPPEEALKDSMDYMRAQYAKNKKGVPARSQPQKSESQKPE